ncbi:hypothetical protein XENTR_v10017589 [Xenopus tropicalis]|nr:hypothetical protein XENTR_v10017589 [Xenopus tropicalis]
MARRQPPLYSISISNCSSSGRGSPGALRSRTERKTGSASPREMSLRLRPSSRRPAVRLCSSSSSSTRIFLLSQRRSSAVSRSSRNRKRKMVFRNWQLSAAGPPGSAFR